MGRPVIVAGHGAALETVDNGVTGFAFPPNDAQALAACMRHIVTMTPEERTRLGWHARENVRDHYSTQAMQYATLSVYDELLHTQLANTFYHAAMADTGWGDEVLPQAG